MRTFIRRWLPHLEGITGVWLTFTGAVLWALGRPEPMTSTMGLVFIVLYRVGRLEAKVRGLARKPSVPMSTAQGYEALTQWDAHRRANR